MSSIVAACSDSPAPRRHRWHKLFLGMLPQITSYAKFAFRHLRPESPAEAVQEVVCNALKAFVRLVQLKKTDSRSTAGGRLGGGWKGRVTELFAP